MQLEATEIAGCQIVRPPLHRDQRGAFAKPFARSAFAEAGLATEWHECFWSSSRRGVVRGFHFQRPPVAHEKLVFCVSGAVADVALDLRVGSPTYGRTVSVELRADDGVGLYLPIGLGHAFQALTDDAVLVYLVSSSHAPAEDAGVRWDSVAHAWPLPVVGVSPRDEALPVLDAFASPFRFA
jgi:dTDP-4-dehydrorhamnose 3,5-epimerase